MAEILLAIESARSRAPQLNNERLLNLMTERQPAEAKTQAPLFGCPGISALGVAGTQPNRGSHNFNGVALMVNGDGLYQVGANGSEVLLGVGIGGSLPVSMASSPTQVCIVNGQHGWIYSAATGLVQITAAAFRPARTVTYMDGYFIFDAVGTDQWFLSALFDGLTFNGLDFATAEGASGTVVAVEQNLELVFVFCTTHIEIWYDAGTADFPFQRYTGGIVNYGCVSPFTITKIDGAIFFLGEDKVFYRLQANVPIRVSTHPIEKLIATEGDLTNVEATSLTVEGHKLIFLTLPVQGVTMCYDISTNRWHERASFDANFNSLGRYRLRSAVTCYNMTICGDAFDGRFGNLDWSLFNEYGLAMYGEVDTVNQHHSRKRLFCSNFEIEVEAGNRVSNGAGSDPQMMLRKSTNGGITYGLPQPWRSMGKTGENNVRLRWTRQGAARQFMWKLSMIGPVRPAIIGGYADLAPGYS